MVRNDHEHEIWDRPIRAQNPWKGAALEVLFMFLSSRTNWRAMKCTDFKCLSHVF